MEALWGRGNVTRLRYRCKCGFPCYSASQEQYHRDGACLAIKRMVSVMAARERCGVRDHTGLEVDGMRLEMVLSDVEMTGG